VSPISHGTVEAPPERRKNKQKVALQE
jgi:hypothetical protein